MFELRNSSKVISMLTYEKLCNSDAGFDESKVRANLVGLCLPYKNDN